MMGISFRKLIEIQNINLHVGQTEKNAASFFKNTHRIKIFISKLTDIHNMNGQAGQTEKNAGFIFMNTHMMGDFISKTNRYTLYERACEKK